MVGVKMPAPLSSQPFIVIVAGSSRWSPMTRIIDMADYPYGYIFSLLGFKLLKFKTSKIMEKERFIVVMSIFGREFILR
jgi:hypothetical protein